MPFAVLVLEGKKICSEESEGAGYSRNELLRRYLNNITSRTCFLPVKIVSIGRKW